MNRHSVRLAALLALVLGALTAHVRALAGPISELDAAKVREAIGSSGRFLAMVRGAYPMVYRPSSVSFHKPEEDDGAVLQLVEIKDERAKSWLALFALEQQPDHTWRISGCVVAENHWRET